ncbi:MAG: type II secretion system protein [Patescibacteria group bacterium]
MRKSNKGFTLIELLVVIAIIGLLSTLAVVALNSARQKSRDSKRVADIKQVQTALELYFADQNSYPIATSAVTLGATDQSALCSNGWAASCGSNTTYMGLVPSNPTPTDCGTGGAYTYSSDTTGSTYTLAFCLGGSVGDLSVGAATANPNGITQP